MIVTPETVARSVANLTLSYTLSMQDEAIDFASIASNYVIDLNGYIYQNSKHSSSCTVSFVSGDNRFAFEKAHRQGTAFLTLPQVRTLGQIMRFLAAHNRRAQVNADDDYLYTSSVSLFRSFAN